jgi:hypothetical protein
MRCLVCGAELEPQAGWDHIRTVHLAPLDLTPEKILKQAQKIAHPVELKTADLTCVKLPEKIIYFSIDNAELLIAYATAHGNIPWTDVVAWQILHEKGHLDLLGRYEPPQGVRLAVVLNAEDYYINRYLIPEKYWPVCLANARCAVAIRNFAPMPLRLRDAYFYLTLAVFLACGAVTVADLPFLNRRETDFVATISPLIKKIRDSQDIPRVSLEVEAQGAPFFRRRPTHW